MSGPIGILRAMFPATATGRPRTLLGYYVGRLACLIGRHQVLTFITWSVRPPHRVVKLCNRDRCDWAHEGWTESR